MNHHIWIFQTKHYIFFINKYLRQIWLSCPSDFDNFKSLIYHMFHAWNVNKESAKNIYKKRRNLLIKCNYTFLVVEPVSHKLLIDVVLKMFDRFIHTFMFLRYAISSGLSLKKAKILKTNVQIKHWNVFIS